MTEPILFAVMAIFAVGFAIAMLLSDNAVHSALFLIGTMGCIAILFLLLNAPFLSMVQITVYTGAIMVLFLFVIMLLGSEQVRDNVTPDVRRSRRRFTIIASFLAAAMFVLVGIPLTNLDLDLATETGELPQVRALNASPDAGLVNVYANDQLIASNLEFNHYSRYVDLAPGDYTLRIEPAEGEGDALTADVSLSRNMQQTLVRYGVAAVGVISDDNTTVLQNRSARVSLFNAENTPISLVDIGSDLNPNDDRVLIEGLEPSALSAPIIVEEGAVFWKLVDATNPANVLYDLTGYQIDRNTSGTIVLTNERIFDGTTQGALRPLAVPVIVAARPSFGGPEAIGLELFGDYMLVFQLLAMLLLAAMIGAIVLTHRELRSSTRRVTGRRRVSRPLVNAIASQVGREVTSTESAPELQEPTANTPVGS